MCSGFLHSSTRWIPALLVGGNKFRDPLLAGGGNNNGAGMPRPAVYSRERGSAVIFEAEIVYKLPGCLGVLVSWCRGSVEPTANCQETTDCSYPVF